MTFIFLLFIITFLIGLYFYSKYNDPSYKEGLTNHENVKANCPNLLIQKDSKFFLYNSKLVKVPGVNPIEFNNLEEYVEFLDWQRSQGIRCPVLYLQKSYDTQGSVVYKARPSVMEPQGGLPPSSVGELPHSSYGGLLSLSGLQPSSSHGETTSLSQGEKTYLSQNETLLVDAGRDDPPYNINSYPGFDATPYYIGTKTPLDKMDEISENMLYSPNPMDTNWGGHDYTQDLIDKGYYKDNNVSLFVKNK